LLLPSAFCFCICIYAFASAFCLCALAFAFAFRLSPFAFCLCIMHFAFCILHFAFGISVGLQPHEKSRAARPHRSAEGRSEAEGEVTDFAFVFVLVVAFL
jgi:hypothetical protein